MNYLLDTHSFLWFINGDRNLSGYALDLITNPKHVIYLSVASLWEMAIKISVEKLKFDEPFRTFIPQQLAINSITTLDINFDHLTDVAHLPLHHKDPFDRLIISQSRINNIPIIGKDAKFDFYDVEIIW